MDLARELVMELKNKHVWNSEGTGLLGRNWQRYWMGDVSRELRKKLFGLKHFLPALFHLIKNLNPLTQTEIRLVGRRETAATKQVFPVYSKCS